MTDAPAGGGRRHCRRPLPGTSSVEHPAPGSFRRRPPKALHPSDTQPKLPLVRVPQPYATCTMALCPPAPGRGALVRSQGTVPVQGGQCPRRTDSSLPALPSPGTPRRPGPGTPSLQTAKPSFSGRRSFHSRRHGSASRQRVTVPRRTGHSTGHGRPSARPAGHPGPEHVPVTGARKIRASGRNPGPPTATAQDGGVSSGRRGPAQVRSRDATPPGGACDPDRAAPTQTAPHAP